MTIIDEYLHYQEKYVKKYGERTIVLEMVGSFYEAYSTESRGYNLAEISEITNATLTKKNKAIAKVDEHNPYLVGFPEVALQKFLRILIQNGFTVVVIDQVSPPPKPRREVVGIYSPSTYIDDAFSPDSNNLVCLYVEDEIQSTGSLLMCIGMSVIDLSTGENSVYEAYGIKDDETAALDEAGRFINSFNPKEILIYRRNPNKKYPNLSEDVKICTKERFITYLELENKKYLYLDGKTDLNKNFTTLEYQNQFFMKIFENTGTAIGMMQPIEFLDMERMTYARIAYVSMLDFAYQHNNDIIKNIYQPLIFKCNKHLILGNNASYQLNLFETDAYSGSNKRYKSLFDVVNNTSTAVGRRFLKTVLNSPLISSEELNLRYNYIEEATKKKLYLKLEQHLQGVIDLERVHRKLALNVLHPWEMANLLESYNKVAALIRLVDKIDKLKGALPLKLAVTKLNKLIKRCEDAFDTDIMKGTNLKDINNSFFKTGMFKDVDDVQHKITENMEFMQNICAVLSNKVSDTSKFKSKRKRNNKSNSRCKEVDVDVDADVDVDVDVDAVDDSVAVDGQAKIYLKRNDREGYYMQLTKLRAGSLKNSLKSVTKLKITEHYSINLTDLKFKELPKGDTKIFLQDLTTKSNELVVYREKLTAIIKDKYIDLLKDIYKENKDMFKKLSDFISLIDFVKSSAKTAVMYNYCKPVIGNGDGDGGSYLCCKALRHPIIERINDSTEYVPHDISIGSGSGKTKLDGMLIYGINSSGKSSMMKAVGLSVIMAQCGMFVPAKQYVFRPYDSLFARITASDNIFKGLSSFALEMTELRAILKRTGPRTLVIGDEVCRGTEHVSGNALVAATLIKLSQTGSTFMFATHLHEIASMSRIKNLDNLGFFHLSVECDEERDVLVFDRQLKPGSGSNLYGILVAKYIIADDKFMKLTMEIKNEMLHKSDMLLSDKKSRYNSKVYIDRCQVCDESNTSIGFYETHHINHQKDCDKNGFVKKKPHIKKNDKSNLIPLCETCHNLVHNGKLDIKGYLDTSKGPMLDIKKQNSISSISSDKNKSKSKVLD